MVIVMLNGDIIAVSLAGSGFWVVDKRFLILNADMMRMMGSTFVHFMMIYRRIVGKGFERLNTSVYSFTVSFFL